MGEALLVEIASIPGEPLTLYKDLCISYAYREIARIECMNFDIFAPSALLLITRVESCTVAQIKPFEALRKDYPNPRVRHHQIWRSGLHVMQ